MKNSAGGEMQLLRFQVETMEQLLGVQEETVLAQARKLEQNEERIRLVVDTAYDAYVATDAMGLITAWNRQAEATFGRSREKAIGLSFSETVISPQSRETYLNYIDQFDKEESVCPGRRIELFGLRSNGSVFPLELTTSVMQYDSTKTLNFFLRDIGEQTEAREELKRHRDHLIKLVEVRTADLAAINHQLQVDIEERKRAEETIARMAYYDVLTGLPNRNMFLNLLRDTIESEKQGDQPFALLLMDIDRFSIINDTLGHRSGDVLLQQLGQRINGALQASDTLARFGGDEFIVLLPGARDVAGTLRTLRKITGTLETPFIVEGIALLVVMSSGIVLFPEHGDDGESLLRCVDVALHEAKETRNGVCAYNSAHDLYSPDRLKLLGELRYAVDRGELFLVYQPKIDVHLGRISGVEALVRWRHPQRGIVPPDQFIYLAEQTGLIQAITLWVLNAAIRQCRIWHQAGRLITVAVNLSVGNLQNIHLPIEVEELLRIHGVPPDFLELEITESIIMADPARAMDILTRLRKFGIRLSIDDFGTGYSSLGYLRKLPVDQVKIDKSFVMDMAASGDDVVIVRSTIDLAHNLGLKVVAEGVETQGTLERLTSLGCDAAQGYYLSRPMDEADLMRWVSDSPWGIKG